jgi:hypothetical protein
MEVSLRFGRINTNQLQGTKARQRVGGRNGAALSGYLRATAKRERSSKASTEGISSSCDIHHRPLCHIYLVQYSLRFVPDQYTFCSHLDRDHRRRKVREFCKSTKRIILKTPRAKAAGVLSGASTLPTCPA